MRKFFDRAANSYDSAAILPEEVNNRLLERLQYMRHQPRTVIDIGCGTGAALKGLQKTYRDAQVYAVDIAEQMTRRARSRYRLLSKKRLVVADMENLPFAAHSFDLVFSSLALPWCNDLNKALAEVTRVARPGALVLFTSYGPATLRELAQSWQAVDGYPHVHRFIDMHDIGDAMLAAGFSQPVVDAELIRMEYSDFDAVLNDLRRSGASNSDLQRRRGLTTPAQLRAVEQQYREHGFDNDRFIASYEILYGHAWVAQADGAMP